MSTHVMDAQGRSGEVIDLVERVRFEIRYLVQFEEKCHRWISESQLAEFSSLFIKYDNKQQILAPSSSTFEQGIILSSGRHSRRKTIVDPSSCRSSRLSSHQIAEGMKQ